MFESAYPKKRSKQEVSFYVSFADVMIILCVFFVLVHSFSEIKTGAFERLKAEFSGSTQGTLVELSKELKKIAENLKGVQIVYDDDGIRVNLESGVLFDTGSAKLKQEDLSYLDPLLKKVQLSRYKIDVEGHTDDRPFYKNIEGEVENNWTLSGRRASSFLNYLLHKGFHEARMRVVGYASLRPYVNIENKESKKSEDLEEARAKNRRVSLFIY